MISPDTIIGGRYRVTKPLGGGGMKLVYLAEDLRLAARPCALAEMVDTFTSPEMQSQAIAAFQREADMLAQLSNEHIPRIFDRFSDANRHYLVMEFVDGITLEQELARNGRKLEQTRVIDIALQILDTLEYLHNLKPPVIYRDLKPSNVMLTASGQVKLIDFGIARFFQPQSNATMIGTQGYAPPEQYRGRAEVRSDLYALGATMHHALTGRDPAAEAPFSFPPTRSLCPGIDTALAELVDQSLAYDVVHRMADATEFKHRLLDIRARLAAGNGRIRPPARTPGQKPQLQLPLGAPTPAAQAAASQQPTVLMAGEAECAACRRTIPSDSRFCSFCGSDVTIPLGAPAPSSTPEAATVVLSNPAPSAANAGAAGRAGAIYREWRDRPSRSHTLGYIALVAIGLFLAAFGVTTILDYLQRPVPQAIPPGMGTAPYRYVPPANPAPGSSYDVQRAQEFRQALDAAGLDAVKFRIQGNTVTLWGTVPDEFARMKVETMAFMLPGIIYLEDHLTVSGSPFAGP